MTNILSNDTLTIHVNSQGAELTSVKNNQTNWEYLWQADPAFWKRHSPVLFPIVGSLWNNQFSYQGKSYPMSQHGFARDMEWELIKKSTDTLLYMLNSNEKTYLSYPFHFELQIGYQLSGPKIEVSWLVKNTGDTDIFFQIGAHPAFNYHNFDPLTDKRGFFKFDKTNNLTYTGIAEKGCVNPDIKYPLILQEGSLLPIDKQTFKHDTIIIENNQIKQVALLDPNKHPYITLHFDAPVVGLWSPPKANAPFVCIEPWYGRCDRVHFEGSLQERDWINSLSSGNEFKRSYIMEFN